MGARSTYDFAQKINQNKGLYIRIARKHSLSQEDAEDIYQNSLIDLLEFKGGGPVKEGLFFACFIDKYQIIL